MSSCIGQAASAKSADLCGKKLDCLNISDDDAFMNSASIHLLKATPSLHMKSSKDTE